MSSPTLSHQDSAVKNSRVFEPEHYGAIPDARTLNTHAFQKAIDACAAAGGGTVVCRCGVYRIGTLVLREGVVLVLEAGATLLASGEIEDYTLEDGRPTGLILADNVSNTGIRGPGCIDGNGDAFWEKLSFPREWAEEKRAFSTWIPHFDYFPKPRPRALILFSNCRDVSIEGLHVKNSFHWTILLLACTGIVLRRITIRNTVHGPNTNGIDLDACQDALVEGCDILTGDKALALKNTNTSKLNRSSKNITVRNCILKSPVHGLCIGTETQQDFENITFSDSEISRAGDCRTMTGICMSSLDGGSIRGVNISNIRIMGSVAPFHIRLGNVGRGQSSPKPGSLSDIHIRNLTSFGAIGVCMVTGLAGYPLENITLSDIALETQGGIPEKRIMKTVPSLDAEYPVNDVWRFLPAHGMYCRHARRLTLSNVNATTFGPDPRPPFVFEEITDLQTNGG